MAKAPKKARRCASCKDKKQIRLNEYRIIERDRTKNVRFCSLVCIDAYLAKKRPTWFARSIRSIFDPDRKTNIHAVRIKPLHSWNPYRDYPVSE